MAPTAFQNMGPVGKWTKDVLGGTAETTAQALVPGTSPNNRAPTGRVFHVPRALCMVGVVMERRNGVSQYIRK